MATGSGTAGTLREAPTEVVAERDDGARLCLGERINPCSSPLPVDYDGGASGDHSKSLHLGGIFSLPDGPKLVGQLVAGVDNSFRNGRGPGRIILCPEQGTGYPVPRRTLFHAWDGHRLGRIGAGIGKSSGRDDRRHRGRARKEGRKGERGDAPVPDGTPRSLRMRSEREGVTIETPPGGDDAQLTEVGRTSLRFVQRVTMVRRNGRTAGAGEGTQACVTHVVRAFQPALIAHRLVIRPVSACRAIRNREGKKGEENNRVCGDEAFPRSSSPPGRWRHRCSLPLQLLLPTTSSRPNRVFPSGTSSLYCPVTFPTFLSLSSLETTVERRLQRTACFYHQNAEQAGGKRKRAANTKGGIRTTAKTQAIVGWKRGTGGGRPNAAHFPCEFTHPLFPSFSPSCSVR
ncbi:hypothetical protein HPB51_020919 [Rhipicephalus microplus]|uniref:Uncharacterized protein n=1 Tax=Rhipicephalus microplus TaxID=6941 RepID=A0A9J6EC01_RHIMP|nr:hypothetical protein HPB51_020919 [Rhipicephalus microplus]